MLYSLSDEHTHTHEHSRYIEMPHHMNLIACTFVSRVLTWNVRQDKGTGNLDADLF